MTTFTKKPSKESFLVGFEFKELFRNCNLLENYTKSFSSSVGTHLSNRDNSINIAKSTTVIWQVFHWEWTICPWPMAWGKKSETDLFTDAAQSGVLQCETWYLPYHWQSVTVIFQNVNILTWPGVSHIMIMLCSRVSYSEGLWQIISLVLSHDAYFQYSDFFMNF